MLGAAPLPEDRRGGPGRRPCRARCAADAPPPCASPAPPATPIAAPSDSSSTPTAGSTRDEHPHSRVQASVTRMVTGIDLVAPRSRSRADLHYRQDDITRCAGTCRRVPRLRRGHRERLSPGDGTIHTFSSTLEGATFISRTPCRAARTSGLSIGAGEALVVRSRDRSETIDRAIRALGDLAILGASR